MSKLDIPEDCAKQWEVLLLLLSSEEKKIDRTNDNEVEVMTYFLNNEGVRKILQHWLTQMHETYGKKVTESDTATKSDSISLYWRQKGNESFRNNGFEESYGHYTKSLLYAYPDGPMYPLALANRSASLMRLKKYEECLSDIELAIRCNYPEGQRHKLYLRQADCHVEMRQAAQASSALHHARCHAAKLQLPPAHSSDFDKHLKMLERKLELLGDLNEPPEEVQLPDCLQGENQDFVCASNILELRCNTTQGRHVKTRAAAERGAVLFVEDPYAAVALPLSENLPVVCEQCYRAQLNPVPCRECSRTVYCGEMCRALAWRAHHRWECTAARARLLPTIGLAHLALRVVLVMTGHGFPALAPRAVDAADVFRRFGARDRVAIYRRGEPAFYRVFHLVTNFDKMNNVDYVQYALTATMLTLYLEQTSFMPELCARLARALGGGGAGQQRLVVSALLLRALGQLAANGHAALHLALCDDPGFSRTQTEREVRHATAIYPSAAMMNHSCDPNIINTFYRSRLIIRLARAVAAGAEVLNCYGPHCAREPAAARRARLRAQYLFHCQCTACADAAQDRIMVFTAYSCPACKGPVVVRGRRAACLQCRSEPPLEPAAQQLRRADELEVQAEAARSGEERVSQLLAAFRLRQRAWHRHHAALRAAADRLARAHADLGEYGKCVELIKQNIQSLEHQYGSFSVQVAHELRKLSGVMLERMYTSPQHPDYRDWCLETHKIIKKAYQLMELNYGSWEPLVRELQRQEEAVAAAVEAGRAGGDGVHNTLHYNLKI